MADDEIVSVPLDMIDIYAGQSRQTFDDAEILLAHACNCSLCVCVCVCARVCVQGQVAVHCACACALAQTRKQAQGGSTLERAHWRWRLAIGR